MRIQASVLVLACMMAGCVGPLPLPEEPQTPSQVLTPNYTYTCPAERTTAPEIKVCAAAFEPGPAAANWPGSMAVMPGNPSVVVWAVKTSEPVPSPASAPAVGFHLLLSRDAGLTWEEKPAPAINSLWESANQVDVVPGGMTFDEKGVLHLVGRQWPSLGVGTSPKVFYITSADLMESWSKPTFFPSGQYAYKPSIVTLGSSVSITWFPGDRMASHRFSRNGGQDWEAAEFPCSVPSNQAVMGGKIHMACLMGAGEELDLLRLNDTGRFERVEFTPFDPPTFYPHEMILRALGQSSLVLAFSGSGDDPVDVIWSEGRPARIIDALAMSEHATKGEYSEGGNICAMDVDSQGIIHHVTIVDDVRSPDAASLYLHVAFDPVRNATIHEEVLASYEGQLGYVNGNYPSYFRNEFDCGEAAFAGERGLLAFGWFENFWLVLADAAP